jgi:ubiquinone biosynthesis protein
MEIKSIRNINRFKNIVWVLFKYGFDDVVHRLELPGSFILRRITRIKTPLTTNERIRRVFQELGPTFIKFGQVLSMRPDLIPGPLLLEMKKLQDRVPPSPTPEVRDLLTGTLRQPIEAVFADFEWEPLGSASLAQVHQARLVRDLHPVAVKVQRPGIRRMINSDLDILAFIAERLNELKNYQLYDFPGLVEELRFSLVRELDFTREARNMKIFRKNLAFPELMYIPEVYEEATDHGVGTRGPPGPVAGRPVPAGNAGPKRSQDHAGSDAPFRVLSCRSPRGQPAGYGRRPAVFSGLGVDRSHYQRAAGNSGRPDPGAAG